MSGKTMETDLSTGLLHNNDWIRRWDEGETGFHQGKPEPFLIESEEKMFDGQKKSVFVPLCGKAEDLFWLYERGHTVCGLEFAEKPIRQFYEEHKMEYDVTDVDNIGKLFQSKDGRLKIYRSDLFDISVEIAGKFDIIYDCRSITAINVCDLQIYKNLMLSLMKDTGTYYMYVYEYDTAYWPGPPHVTDDKMVKELFGDRCEIEMLKEMKRTNPDASPEPPKERPTQIRIAMSMMPSIVNRWYRMQFQS